MKTQRLRRRDLLLKYFENFDTNQMQCAQDICQGKLLRDINSNLERHLKLVHPCIFECYAKEKEALMTPKRKRVSDHTNSVAATTPSPTTCLEIYAAPVDYTPDSCEENIIRIDDTDIIEEENNEDDEENHNIQLALLDMFVNNQRPMAMLKKHSFQLIMQDLFRQLNVSPGCKGVQQLIRSQMQQIKANILSDIKNKLVSLKFDAMTRSGRTLLAVNVQYIKGAMLLTKTLAIKEVRPEYGDEFFESLVNGVIMEYSLAYDNILTCTFDSGQTLMQIPEVKGIAMSSDDFGNVTIIRMIEQKVSQSQSSCKAKNFSSAAALFEACMNEVCADEVIQERIEMCRLYVKKLIQSSPELKEGLYEPLTDNAFNWLSTYDMLRRLLEIHENVAVQLMPIPDDLAQFLREFLSILEPFYNITVKLQHRNAVLSELYFFLMELTMGLMKVNTTEMSIKVNLLESLYKWKTQLFSGDLFRSAMYLDPRIRSCLTSSQQDQAKVFLLHLNDRLEILRGYNFLLDTNDAMATRQSFSEYAEKLTEAAMKNEESDATLINRAVKIRKIKALEREMTLYETSPRLPLDADILQLWSNQSNRLAEIAKMILAIPFTQVSIKRLFPSLDFLENESEDYQQFDTESIMFVRLNGDFQ